MRTGIIEVTSQRLGVWQRTSEDARACVGNSYQTQAERQPTNDTQTGPPNSEERHKDGMKAEHEVISTFFMDHGIPITETRDSTTRDANGNTTLVREYYSNNEKVATYSNQFDKDGNAVNFQVKFEKRSK